METEPAFIRPDRAVHLDTVPSVHVNGSTVIRPWNAEHNDSFGFNNSLKDLCVAILRMLVQHDAEGVKNFLNGLVKFRLAGIFCFYISH